MGSAESNKKKNGIALLCIVLGLIIVIIAAVHSEKTEYEYQKFGVVQDGTLYISDDTVYEVDFTIEKDNFKGVQVYLDFDGMEFNEAYLDFSLYNQDTEELICQYQMDMQYEYSKKYVFAELPVEQSKDMNVRLLITGENLPGYIRAKYSKDSDSAHTLYKNGKKSKQYIVMRGVYETETSNVMGILVDYAIFLFIAILLRFDGWKNVDLKRETSNGRVKVFAGKLYSMVREHRKETVYLCSLLLIGIVAFFYYNLEIKDALKQKTTVSELKVSASEEIGLNENSSEIEQVFKASKDDLSELIVQWRGEGIDSNSKINVQIIDNDNNVVILDKTCYVKDVVDEKTTKYTFKLNQNIKDSEDREFTMKIIPLNFGSTVVYFLGADADSDAYLQVEEVSQVNNIALDVVYADNDFILVEYVILIALLVCILSVAYFLCFCGKLSIERIFVVLALGLGCIYMLVITPYGVPDEASHIDTAYRYSNRLLGVEESDKPGYDYKRLCDVDVLTDVSARTSVDIYSYQRLYYGFFERVDSENLTECYMRDNATNGGILYYFPSVIGITIARLLHLGTIPMILLGRLFTLITYVVIVRYAIKKIPYGKLVFFLLATLPISMQQAASFSYDALINAYAMFFIAYVLYLANSKEIIGSKDLIILVIFGILVIGCKSGVYSPICLMIMYIPYKRGQWNVRSIAYYGMIFGITVLFFMKSFIISIINRLGTAGGTSSAGGNGGEAYTFGYFKTHPLKLVSIFVNTLFEKMDAYLKNLLGGTMGWLDIDVGWVYAIVFLFLIIFASTEIYEKIDKKDKIIFVFIAILSYALVNFSMLLAWTPKSSDYVVGVQGRYFIPFAFFVVSAFSFKGMRYKENKLLFGAMIIHFFEIIRIVMLAV